MLNTWLLKPLEKALDRYLALDPEAHKRLTSLEGKTITLQFASLNLSFQLRIIDQKIQLFSGEDYPAEVKIKGTPLSLLALAFTADKKERFFADDISIEGDAELGQEIVDLFDLLDIDWEEQLSRRIGDLPAHQLGRFTRGIINWGKEAKERFFQNAHDYVHEEKPWLPPTTLLQEFLQDVDELRMDADRLEARVKNMME